MGAIAEILKAPRICGKFRGAGHIRIATEYGIGETKHIIETAATLDGEARVPNWYIEVRRDGLVIASACLFSPSKTHANNLARSVHHAFVRRALKKSNQNFRKRLAKERHNDNA